MLCRLFCSPVPAQMTFGSEGAMAMSPNVLTGWSSKIGFQVVPLLVEIQMPPEAVASKIVEGSWGRASRS